MWWSSSDRPGIRRESPFFHTSPAFDAAVSFELPLERGRGVTHSCNCPLLRVCRICVLLTHSGVFLSGGRYVGGGEILHDGRATFRTCLFLFFVGGIPPQTLHHRGKKTEFSGNFGLSESRIFRKRYVAALDINLDLTSAWLEISKVYDTGGGGSSPGGMRPNMLHFWSIFSTSLSFKLCNFLTVQDS